MSDRGPHLEDRVDVRLRMSVTKMPWSQLARLTTVTSSSTDHTLLKHDHHLIDTQHSLQPGLFIRPITLRPQQVRHYKPESLNGGLIALYIRRMRPAVQLTAMIYRPHTRGKPDLHSVSIILNFRHTNDIPIPEPSHSTPDQQPPNPAHKADDTSPS